MAIACKASSTRVSQLFNPSTLWVLMFTKEQKRNKNKKMFEIVLKKKLKVKKKKV